MKHEFLRRLRSLRDVNNNGDENKPKSVSPKSKTKSNPSTISSRFPKRSNFAEALSKAKGLKRKKRRPKSDSSSKANGTSSSPSQRDKSRKSRSSFAALQKVPENPPKVGSTPRANRRVLALAASSPTLSSRTPICSPAPSPNRKLSVLLLQPGELRMAGGRAPQPSTPTSASATPLVMPYKRTSVSTKQGSLGAGAMIRRQSTALIAHVRRRRRCRPTKVLFIEDPRRGAAMAGDTSQPTSMIFDPSQMTRSY